MGTISVLKSTDNSGRWHRTNQTRGYYRPFLASSIPPPDIIDSYEKIERGLGKRILDDAHQDTIADRQNTQKAFDYRIWEAKAGFIVATIITVLGIVGTFLSLLFLDPPESIAGSIFLGIATLTPLANTFVNRGQQRQHESAASLPKEDER